MEQGTWTIAACPTGEVRSARRGARRSTPTLASVLVRRGLRRSRPRRARSSRARCPATTRFALGDMAEAVERDPRPRSRPASGSASTATTTPTGSARPRSPSSCCASSAPTRLAPALALRGGLRARRPDARAARRRGRRARAHGRLRHHRRRRGRGGARGSGSRSSSRDHHRPGERFPDCPVVAPLKGDYPFAGLCGTGGRLEARPGAARRGAPVPRAPPRRGRARDRRRRRAARSTRAARSRSLGLRRLAQTQKPGLRALMRVAGVDPAACDEGAIGFRLAPRINAAGRLGRPEAALAAAADRRRARGARGSPSELEELNRERQAVEERILRAAIDRDRVLAGSSAAPPRLRRRRRGLARGRDRDRRLAPRRALRPAGRPDRRRGRGRRLEGLGPRRRLVRPARRRSRACAEHLERFGGHRAAAGLSIQPEHVEAFAEAFAAHADAVLERRRPRGRRITIDAIVPGAELGLPLCEELARLAPFGLGNPGVTLLVDDCELDRARHGRRRASTSASASASAAATPARRSPSALGSQLDRYRRVGHYDVAFRLQENRWNGTVSPQLVVRRIFDTDERYEELRAWFAEQWRRGEAAWTPEARAVFAELELGRGGAAEPARVGDVPGAARGAAAARAEAA